MDASSGRIFTFLATHDELPVVVKEILTA